MDVFYIKLCVGLATSTTYLSFMCIDWYIRIILDAEDGAYTIREKLWFCRTKYYIRLLTFCCLLFGSIWLNLFILYSDEPLLFSIVNAGVIVTYLSMDWFQTAYCTQQHFTSSNNQLISTKCCSNKKNSFGLTVSSFGCIISFGNWIIFIILIDKYQKHFDLYYSIFWIIMICLYLIISLILEIYHFRIVWNNAFLMESAVTPGIYGFVGIISRPTFRLLHCFNRYLIMIIWLIFGYKYNFKIFFCILYPLTICIWYIGSFFQRSRNRPKPKGVLQKLWRKYVEYLYRRACNKHSSINPNFKTTKIVW